MFVCPFIPTNVLLSLEIGLPQDSRDAFDDTFQSSAHFDQKCQSSAFSIPSASISPINHASESDFKHCEHVEVSADVALFNEFNTNGSLFSVHSAPPVQLVNDLHLSSAQCIAIDKTALQSDAGDSSRRPISLAIDSQQNFSTKSAFIELNANKRNSECDDDDNDNLLTVSSVTARPLIAKSRELRNSK